MFLEDNRKNIYQALDVKTIGSYFRPNDQRKICFFLKYVVGHFSDQVHEYYLLVSC